MVRKLNINVVNASPNRFFVISNTNPIINLINFLSLYSLYSSGQNYSTLFYVMCFNCLI